MDGGNHLVVSLWANSTRCETSGIHCPLTMLLAFGPSLRPQADRLDVGHDTLAHGRLCDVRIWRQIVTILDTLALRRSAYESVLVIRCRPAEVLESLDREARRLFGGDRLAAPAIRAPLDYWAHCAPRAYWSTPEGAKAVRLGVAQLQGGPAGFFRIQRESVVNPVALLFIAEAVDYAAGLNKSRRVMYANVLDRFLPVTTGLNRPKADLT